MLAKGLAILALAAVAAVLLRRRSAAVRYVAWAVGMTGLLALPLLSPVVPAWRIPLPSIVAPSVALESAPVPAASDLVARPSRARWPAPSHTPSAATVADRAGEPTGLSLSALAGLPWPLLLTALWVAGSVIAILRLVVGLIRVQGVRRRAAALEVSEWRDDMDTCAAQLGLSYDVDLLTSDEVQVPMTCGWRRPAVLVPSAALHWSDERRRVVLLHELAHVRRGDFGAHVAASLAAALHWLNPLAWIAIKRMRTEREGACDDSRPGLRAVATDYAEHLLDIARTLTNRPAPAVALAMARRSELEGRLLAILDNARARGTARPRIFAVAVLALSLFVLPTRSVPARHVCRSVPADGHRRVAGPTAPAPLPSPAPTPSADTHADPHAPRERPTRRPAPTRFPTAARTRASRVVSWVVSRGSGWEASVRGVGEGAASASAADARHDRRTSVNVARTRRTDRSTKPHARGSRSRWPRPSTTPTRTSVSRRSTPCRT